MSTSVKRRVVERALATSFAQRALGSIRRRSGLDADLAELGERVERLERAVLPDGVTALETRGSTRALATRRDADLLEHVLTAAAARASGALDVLEWGTGLSTLHYPDWLARSGVRVSWLAVEHDREFFRTFLEEGLRAQRARVVWTEEPRTSGRAAWKRAGVTAVVFDEGPIDPVGGSSPAADRKRDLDDYVRLPATLERRFDVILVDGRKRRRCLLEAAGLLRAGGIVLLHDANRPYYRCAFDSFRSGRRIGDELWIGAQAETDFADLVPADALGPPAGAQVSAKRVGASRSSSAPA